LLVYVIIIVIVIVVSRVFSFFVFLDFYNFPKTNVIKFIVALKVSHFNYYY